jgi:hypothetical protein
MNPNTPVFTNNVTYGFIRSSKGIQGTTGLQGTTGIQGTTGLQGTNGTQGTEGAQGVTGIQGLTGLQGTAGYIGADGAQGTQGLQGTQGTEGINGTNGAQGTQGIQGGFSFGLGTGVETFLSTPSSANLAAALTDETGTGANVFATSPTLTTPALGAATATSIAFPDTLVGSATGSSNNFSLITVDTWSATTYSSAKYIVQITSYSGYIQVIEVLVAVDPSNNVYLTKYASINSQVIDGIAYDLATINAVYSGGNVLLQVTGIYGSISVGVSKTYIEKILAPEPLVAEE